MGNYIYLSEYRDEDEFQKSLLNPTLDKDRFSVFIHEMQHYFDHVSTLWGALRLCNLYQAFDAVLKFNEYEFYKLRELELNVKRDIFLDYYTENYAKISGDFNDRWGFEITSGSRFSPDGKVNEDLPILFVVFYSSKKEKISRVPLSVVSLLETSAIFSEFDFLMSEAMKLSSPFKENQVKAIFKKFESLLYNPDLTLYSVAVHLVSVNLQISNPIDAYKSSSLLAKIALNIPSKLFQTIKIHSQFEISEVWQHKAKKMLENQERGFVFYLLIKNYVELFGVDPNNLTVENILKASNLPTEQEVEELVLSEIAELDSKITLGKNSLTKAFSNKVFLGNRFRQLTGIGQQKPMRGLTEFEGDIPYLLFPGTYFEYEELKIDAIVEKLFMQQELNIDEWFRFYTMCERRIDDFNTICGI